MFIKKLKSELPEKCLKIKLLNCNYYGCWLLLYRYLCVCYAMHGVSGSYFQLALNLRVM